jgi:hypothetical protein
MYILNNQHEFGPPQSNSATTTPLHKRHHHEPMGSLLHPRVHNLGLLIKEQQPPSHNPLFTLRTFNWQHQTVSTPYLHIFGWVCQFLHTLCSILTFYLAATHLILLLLLCHFFNQDFNYTHNFFIYSHGVYLVLILAYNVAYTQFWQDHFGLPEDGAPEAPKHVGARLIFEIYGLLWMHFIGFISSEKS